MESSKNYGYEPNYELNTFDPNIYQGYTNTCAIRSQEIILRDYGFMFSQDELVKFATQNGWFNPDPVNGGTNKYAVGNILDACGIQTTRVENASIQDIIAELKAGHRIIVCIDSDELWIKKETNLIKRLIGEEENKANDASREFLGIDGANHALIVAGVQVDTDNPSDMRVVITDPGTGDVCVEYNLSDFQEAWEDGNCLMVTTNIPAPYQYNYTTHQMEPSGFFTDYLPSMASMPVGMNNLFHLSDSYYMDYADYVPLYGERQEHSSSGKDEDTGFDGSYALGDHGEILDASFNNGDVSSYDASEDSLEPHILENVDTQANDDTIDVGEDAGD